MKGFWGIVERFGVTVFSGVPTIYASLLDTPIGDHDVSSLRFGVVGAAPMPVSVITTFEQRTGIRILELYGMTESTCVSTCNPRDGDRR
jgi:fatty-acyl-CoA synthase